jgi:hypothetical protein
MWSASCPTPTQSRHVTIHHMTMWCNVTCITFNSYTVTSQYITWQCDAMWLASRSTPTQSHHNTSHDNVMQCDLYPVQLLHSHITLHYITSLNNTSSPATSTDLICWREFITSTLINTTTIITNVSDKCSLINHTLWYVLLCYNGSLSAATNTLISGHGALTVTTQDNVSGLPVTIKQTR